MKRWAGLQLLLGTPGKWLSLGRHQLSLEQRAGVWLTAWPVRRDAPLLLDIRGQRSGEQDTILFITVSASVI
jgi:hypothetical protein